MFGRRDPQGRLFNVPFWAQGLVAQDSFCTRMGRLWSQRKVLQHIVVALRSLGPQPVVVLGPKGYYILCRSGRRDSNARQPAGAQGRPVPGALASQWKLVAGREFDADLDVHQYLLQML